MLNATVKVVYSDADEVEVRREDGSLDVYTIQKFRRSNSGTAYNQRTLVKVGDIVEKGDFIATVHLWKVEKWPSVKTLSSLMTWEDYNFELPLSPSERLVKDDVYTSVPWKNSNQKHAIQSLGLKLHVNLPNVGEKPQRP